MSKESISRDRFRQAGQANYRDWCKGCGLYLVVNGKHRADCTLTPPPCPECLYYPAVNAGQHRAGCTNTQSRLEAAT
ncbi:hypothetical protein H7J86_26155 [Mycobacterium hackensackense]|uniref:hypothetical protein n=1 Tax=Mycobacterium hackensackense TaxID=228909 RepID=UPI002265E0B6|nr:hypothetical protein [Mycobacterium hackensackense]MCV7255652.1 hypothetical protein [Mycobacterium hackensackense]